MWEKWHNVVIPARGKIPAHPHWSSRFKNGDEWFERHLNRGRSSAEETCQMELMFVGGSEEEREETK
jgi:hypothetical protein